MVTRQVNQNGSGFTLIELLVVIAVISILLGMVLPVLHNARVHSRTFAGLSNLSQIGRGFSSYLADYKGTYPTGWRQDLFPKMSGEDTNWAWIINGHLSKRPSNRQAVVQYETSNVFRDPSAAVDGGSIHYTGHPIILVDATRTSLTHYRAGQLVRPTQVVLVMDGSQVPPGNNVNATAVNIDQHSLWDEQSRPVYYDPTAVDNGQPIVPGPNEDSLAAAGLIRWRQYSNTSANFLFCDGHATTLKPRDITKANIRPDR